MAALGPAGAAPVPRHVRVRAGRREERGPLPGSRPAGHQAALLHAARRRGDLRLRAEGAGRGGRHGDADPAGRPGRFDALLLGARAVVRHRQVSKLPAGSWARFSPDGRSQLEHYWRIAEVAAEAAAGPAADLGSVIEESVAAHLIADVPVSSFLSGGLDSSIDHRPGPPGGPGDRRLHDHVPARGPAARGDARRRRLRAQGRSAIRRRPARDRDLPGHRGPPAADGGHARRADRRSRRHQHAADVPGRPRARRQGDPLRHGRRRAVRRLPQAPRVRDGGPLPPAAGSRTGRAALCRGPGPGQPRRPGPALRALREALPDLCRPARGARFRRSYTLYDGDELTSLVGPDLAGYVDQVLDGHSAIYHDNSLSDEVNRMCLADSRLFLPGLNLAYSDRASMAASVEVRVPFVDPVVARAAFSIKGSDKISGLAGQARAQARRGKLAAARDRVPAEGLLQRPAARLGAQRPAAAHQRRAGRRRADRSRADPVRPAAAADRR